MESQGGSPSTKPTFNSGKRRQRTDTAPHDHRRTMTFSLSSPDQNRVLAEPGNRAGTSGGLIACGHLRCFDAQASSSCGSSTSLPRDCGNQHYLGGLQTSSICPPHPRHIFGGQSRGGLRLGRRNQCYNMDSSWSPGEASDCAIPAQAHRVDHEEFLDAISDAIQSQPDEEGLRRVLHFARKARNTDVATPLSYFLHRLSFPFLVQSQTYGVSVRAQTCHRPAAGASQDCDLNGTLTVEREYGVFK